MMGTTASAWYLFILIQTTTRDDLTWGKKRVCIPVSGSRIFELGQTRVTVALINEFIAVSVVQRVLNGQSIINEVRICHSSVEPVRADKLKGIKGNKVKGRLCVVVCSAYE